MGPLHYCTAVVLRLRGEGAALALAIRDGRRLCGRETWLPGHVGSRLEPPHEGGAVEGGDDESQHAGEQDERECPAAEERDCTVERGLTSVKAWSKYDRRNVLRLTGFSSTSRLA